MSAIETCKSPPFSILVTCYITRGEIVDHRMGDYIIKVTHFNKLLQRIIPEILSKGNSAKMFEKASLILKIYCYQRFSHEDIFQPGLPHLNYRYLGLLTDFARCPGTGEFREVCDAPCMFSRMA